MEISLCILSNKNQHTFSTSPKAFLTITNLKSHYVYFASEMNLVSNRPFTVLVLASVFSGDFLLHRYDERHIKHRHWHSTDGFPTRVNVGHLVRRDTKEVCVLLKRLCYYGPHSQGKPKFYLYRPNKVITELYILKFTIWSRFSFLLTWVHIEGRSIPHIFFCLRHRLKNVLLDEFLDSSSFLQVSTKASRPFLHIFTEHSLFKTRL